MSSRFPCSVLGQWDFLGEEGRRGKVSAQSMAAEWWFVGFVGDALGQAAKATVSLHWGDVVTNCFSSEVS